MAATDSTKDYSPDELIKAISDLQVTKQRLKEQKQTLEKERVIALQEAYVIVQGLNDEQAQIHFANAENGVSFSNRFKSSLRSMKKEIKKNENLIQLRGDNVAEDVDDITRELEEKEEILAGLLLSIKAPVLLKSEAVDQLKSQIRAAACASSASNGASFGDGIFHTEIPSDAVLQSRELALFENVDQFEKHFNAIIQKREKEIAAAMDEVRMHRNSCTKQLFASLDAQVEQILMQAQNSSNGNKRKVNSSGNGRESDKKDAVLEEFLMKAQSEHKVFVSKYDAKSYELAEQIRKRRGMAGKVSLGGSTARMRSSRSSSPNKSHNGCGGGGGNKNDNIGAAGTTGEEHATINELGIDFEKPWKVELQNQLNALHEMERQFAEEEAALDRETIATIQSMRLGRSQHGSAASSSSSSSSNIDEAYVNSVMDNLAKLYININESLID